MIEHDEASVTTGEEVGAMHTVSVLPDGPRVDVRTNETIVDGLRRTGWRSRSSCRRGGCGVCQARLVDGQIRYAHPVADTVLSGEEMAAGLCLPCRAIPTTDVAVDLGSAALRPILASTVPPASSQTSSGTSSPASSTAASKPIDTKGT